MVSRENDDRARELLLNWWEATERPFPWRQEWEEGSASPYRVFVTEILLQKTRAESVASLYERFFLAFPDWESLARASFEALYEILQPLGLQRVRAGRLLRLARDVMGRTEFPDEHNLIEELDGAGEYAAACVASFCYDEQVPALDVNSSRVIKRCWGIDTGGQRPARHKEVVDSAKSLMRGASSREVNLALIDLGMLVCRPRPLCDVCPLSELCKFDYEKDGGIKWSKV